MDSHFQQSPNGARINQRPNANRGGRTNSRRGQGRGRGSGRGHSSADAVLHGTRGGRVGRSRAAAYRVHMGSQQQQQQRRRPAQNFSAGAQAYWQPQQQQQQQQMMMPPPPPPPRPWLRQQRGGGIGGGDGGGVAAAAAAAVRGHHAGSPTGRQKRYMGAAHSRRRGGGSGGASSTSAESPVADESTAPTPSTPPGGGGSSGQQKFVAIYGNFRSDYSRQTRAGSSDFNISQMQDDRLQLLQPDWYVGRDVLDIGSNDGVFAMRIAEAMGVRSLTGVDIDEELVRIAQNNLSDRVREAEQQDGQASERAGFPYNVTFKTGNYVLDSDSELQNIEENKYDIIQAFSITKWIHLNWGDRGLKLFFKRAYRELRPDGKFILEPQPYKSYQRTLLCPAHKQNYASNIELRPEQFKQYLEREVGFAHIVSVWEQQQCHGFQQPLLLCSKPSGQTPALAREPSQHNFRVFVPSHPLRAQLNVSPYVTDSVDQFFVDGDNGLPEDLLDADDEPNNQGETAADSKQHAEGTNNDEAKKKEAGSVNSVDDVAEEAKQEDKSEKPNSNSAPSDF